MYKEKIEYKPWECSRLSHLLSQPPIPDLPVVQVPEDGKFLVRSGELRAGDPVFKVVSAGAYLEMNAARAFCAFLAGVTWKGRRPDRIVMDECHTPTLESARALTARWIKDWPGAHLYLRYSAPAKPAPVLPWSPAEQAAALAVLSAPVKPRA